MCSPACEQLATCLLKLRPSGCLDILILCPSQRLLLHLSNSSLLRLRPPHRLLLLQPLPLPSNCLLVPMTKSSLVPSRSPSVKSCSVGWKAHLRRLLLLLPLVLQLSQPQPPLPPLPPQRQLLRRQLKLRQGESLLTRQRSKLPTKR